MSQGDTLATIYANDPDKAETALSYLKDAFVISQEQPQQRNMIYRVI